MVIPILLQFNFMTPIYTRLLGQIIVGVEWTYHNTKHLVDQRFLEFKWTRMKPCHSR